MTFLELQTDTKRMIREATGSGIYFSDEDIRTAINDGYMELSDATEWLEEYYDLDLLVARPYYDLFSIIGPDFLSIKPAFDSERHRWLVPVAVRALDGNDSRWERVVGAPQRIFMRGIRWLGLYPRTNAEGTDQIKLYLTRLPVPMCEDDDEPGFPEAYHLGCEYYAMADLFAQDGETKLALDAWEDYLAVEAALNDWMNTRPERPLMRVFGSSSGEVPR